MGAGPTAVGSVTVDNLTLSPLSITDPKKDATAYRFHAIRTFSRASVEFYRDWDEGNETLTEYVKHDALKSGIREDSWIGEPPHLRTWNGKNDNNKMSAGQHRMLVRVWTNPSDDGSWLVARSKQMVTVV